jgi:hypothetical protein
VSALSARSARWPLIVVKKLASGVPRWGALMVVTLARRDRHASVRFRSEREELGDATSRASSPPVE